MDHHHRLNDHANKLDKLNTGYVSNDENIREACRNIVDRYTTQEQSRALDEKIDLVNAQVQALMSAIASMNIPVTIDAQPTEFHNVGNPRNSDPQQPADTDAPSLDPWAQSAEAARARASQPTQAAPSAWVPSQTAPSAPAVRSPFVDDETRDVPTAPGLPRGWDRHTAEPFTPAHRPARGDGFVPPGANPHTRVRYMGTQRLSIVKMKASANLTGRP